ncbi:hypothetical protein NM688_g5968 [Phlebia brevispora]|uniref:Uncharacterized protein n=1 Tax=Phlebia brevispora TaxID=194682 RepID=A0ACC1SM11_9APHY|nr:hypothetical protein NM688_g5968 [Phlebia brevispora]
MTHVCHRWRDVALAAPTLWPSISISVHDKPFPSSEAMAVWLGRTGKALLSAEVWGHDFWSQRATSPVRELLSSFIIEQLPRMREFDLSTPRELPSSFEWPPSVYPCLDSLYLDSETPTWEPKVDSISLRRDFSRHFPALKKLTLKNYHQFDFQTWTLPPTLTHLEIQNYMFTLTSALPNVLEVLRRLRSLSKLSLLDTFSHDSDLPGNLEAVELPLLQSLTLRGRMDDNKLLLDHLQSPPFARLLSELEAG